MRCLPLVLSLVFCLFSLLSPVGATPLGLRCTAPEQITRFKVKLPYTAHAIRHGMPLIIVAIGSSSTQGVGASDQRYTYPAVLAQELRRRWPRLAITVINKGIGGETAEQTFTRFSQDVMAYHPQLVIWQSGTNQAFVQANIARYARVLRTGIARLRAAHMDVILMDPQYAPLVLQRPISAAIINTLNTVGNDLHVAVFQRFAVMHSWVTQGQYTMQDIIAQDQLHMNDTSYQCLARLLADSLAAAVVAAPPLQLDEPDASGSNVQASMPMSSR